MSPAMRLKLAVVAAVAFAQAASGLTIYTSLPGSIPTQFLGPNGQFTGLPEFDPVVQTPPAAPAPTGTAISVALQTGAVPGLSGKQQRTDFVGISLEMSVSSSIIGRNGTFVDPVFLNYIQNLRARSGTVSIRIGGNSQEKVNLVPAWAPNVGLTIAKANDTSPTPVGFRNSPLLTISNDLFYAMANVSAFVNVAWYFGLPFLNEAEIPAVAGNASAILGSNLQGFQMANEPDLYQNHLRKPTPYGVPEYLTDWGRVRSTFVPSRTDLLAPNICCDWTIDQVLAAGFLTTYGQYLKAVTVQHYKDSACPVATTIGALTPQQAFVSYQNHDTVKTFMLPYVNASTTINAAGKDFILLETNTASCGGFAGASDSYAAGLYLLDITLQAASIGIAQVLLHNGGAGQFYNLMTPPPANQSSFRSWTTTAPYYTALIMAEAMAEQGSQVLDLNVNNGNALTPGYAIYKGGNPIKVALFNYANDPSGANDVQVSINVPGAPASVSVKYFSSATGSTADKFNLTWAGQTMGDEFKSDGRLQGNEATMSIACNAGTCTIPVKAPQFALVFLDGQDSVNPQLSTQTFPTTIATKLIGTVIVPPSVLATSNGRGGAQEAFNVGQTSHGSTHSAAERRAAVVKGAVLGAVVAAFSGVWLMMR